MTHPSAMSELARWFGAPEEVLRTDWGDTLSVRWKFWSFTVTYDGGGYGFTAPEAGTHRWDLSGVADELNRRPVRVLVGGDTWVLRASVDILRGVPKAARVFVSTPMATPLRGSLRAAVTRGEDFEGWPLAVGALYHGRLEPLLDHLFEAPQYQALRPPLEAAWLSGTRGDRP